MDTLSHFILALLAGLAMGLHRKHKLSLIVFISFCSILIDLDHFLLSLGYATQRCPFHNVFIVFLIPFTLFLISYYLERNTPSDKFQVFFLLLTIMLTGHLIADMVGRPVRIFYPLSDMMVSIPKVDIQATDEFASGIVNSHGVGMAIYAVIIFIGVFIHDIMYHQRRKHLNFRDALRHAIGDWL